ncbi:MAG: Xaa-Pro peptidase family protein [Verrucomicrobiales bacterium]|nr:Xaa-Pro peptidase family protein [Verrucomicrobiales bacterium]
MPVLPTLSIEQCRSRQNRLRTSMQKANASRAIITSRENVHWLTGFWTHPLMKSAAVIDLEGNCTLFAPNSEPEFHAASQVEVFEASPLCTLRQDQIELILGKVESPATLNATEFSDCPVCFREKMADNIVDIGPEILKLRRTKDSDEVDMLRHAIACTDAMYRKAREIIEPGITELEVFSKLQRAGVLAAGEPLTACGNDYRSNAPGGPPRDRKVEAGELMILDLGPAYRGYNADNCRTFSVNPTPNDEQMKAWGVIRSVLDMVESEVRPGASCKALYEKAKGMLDEYKKDSFFHHLGHGIGLFPHEAPHLNPTWDEVFQVGDVFAAEPGLYTEELKAGIRIEENYLVTEHGIEKLTSTPIEIQR